MERMRKRKRKGEKERQEDRNKDNEKQFIVIPEVYVEPDCRSTVQLTSSVTGPRFFFGATYSLVKIPFSLSLPLFPEETLYNTQGQSGGRILFRFILRIAFLLQTRLTSYDVFENIKKKEVKSCKNSCYSCQTRYDILILIIVLYHEVGNG